MTRRSSIINVLGPKIAEYLQCDAVNWAHIHGGHMLTLHYGRFLEESILVLILLHIVIYGPKHDKVQSAGV